MLKNPKKENGKIKLSNKKTKLASLVFCLKILNCSNYRGAGN